MDCNLRMINRAFSFFFVRSFKRRKHKDDKKSITNSALLNLRIPAASNLQKVAWCMPAYECNTEGGDILTLKINLRFSFFPHNLAGCVHTWHCLSFPGVLTSCCVGDLFVFDCIPCSPTYIYNYIKVCQVCFPYSYNIAFHRRYKIIVWNFNIIKYMYIFKGSLFLKSQRSVKFLHLLHGHHRISKIQQR